MPAYSYRAVHGSGRVSKGVATASSEAELVRFLSRSQLELIEAKEKKKPEQRHSGSIFSSGAVPLRSLALFCSQVGELLKAGVPFPDALADLSSVMPSGRFRDSLHDITRAINHGTKIAKAFASHPRIFNGIFVAILASGESSGDLACAFSQLATYTEGRARMNERLTRALRYPLFLMVLAFAVVTFMMVLVVPQILSFLNSIDSQLPIATRVLVGVSTVFSRIWWMVGCAILSSFALVSIVRRYSMRVRLLWDGLLLRLPVIGGVMEKMMVARFVQCFSILVQSGLNIPESILGARDTLGNQALIARLDQVSRKIVAGQSLSSAMDVLLPPFAVRVLRIGEQSGRLVKALDDIAAYYEREAGESADRMIGMLEPGLTLFIGFIMAWVVLAVLGPIYGSLSHMNVMG